MGLVQDNHGSGRDVEGPDSNGNYAHRIQAWVGCKGTPDHDCIDLGSALSATDRATWSAAAAVAHASGKAAWESHMAATYAGWSTWYGALSASRQTGLYEAMRIAGQYSLPP